MAAYLFWSQLQITMPNMPQKGASKERMMTTLRSAPSSFSTNKTPTCATVVIASVYQKYATMKLRV